MSKGLDRFFGNGAHCCSKTKKVENRMCEKVSRSGRVWPSPPRKKTRRGRSSLLRRVSTNPSYKGRPSVPCKPHKPRTRTHQIWDLVSKRLSSTPTNASEEDWDYFQLRLSYVQKGVNKNRLYSYLRYKDRRILEHSLHGDHMTSRPPGPRGHAPRPPHQFRLRIWSQGTPR